MYKSRYKFSVCLLLVVFTFYQVLPTVNVQSVLQTIYRLNVMRYCDGKMGAVNGMMPDGTVDRSAVQSEEVWTGVVYSLGAFMIHEVSDKLFCI